jgi:hypothetical protein
MKQVKSVLLLTRKGVKKSLSASGAKRKELKDWWDSKPKPISLYPGEKEIFREGPVLVTDTRVSHMDPFDRVLKTYMFEHMISLNKNFYHASPKTRRFCVGLIVLTFLTLLFTAVIDLLDDNSRHFAPVYIPLLISLLVGLIVWRDMRPKYRIEWLMKDGIKGGISTEPLFREWLFNNNGREQFMNKLVEAMNKAIAGKAWWPHRDQFDENRLNSYARQTDNSKQDKDSETPTQEASHNGKKHLKLVTDSYE